jgi:hypothetical protein
VLDLLAHQKALGADDSRGILDMGLSFEDQYNAYSGKVKAVHYVSKNVQI